MKGVAYRKVNVKYRLEAFHKHELRFDAGVEVKTEFYRIDGRTLIAYKDYGWDGPSGPTVDTRDTIRASLIHDILYQALRDKNLPPTMRKLADKEFRRILKEDGMNWLRRQCWYLAVRIGAASSAKPEGQE